MTSANIVKLPVQNLNKSDQNKNTDKKDNAYALSFQSEFKNIVQDLNQGSLKSINSSNGISSLKSVMSTYSLTVNSKVSINLADKASDIQKSTPSANTEKVSTGSEKASAGASSVDTNSSTPVSNSTPDRSTDNTASKLSDKATNDIKDAIEKRLGVSDKQLESAMEKLGLKYEDLQDPSNLLNLAAYLVGNGDTQNLLLTNGVKELMNDVKDIFSRMDQSNLNGSSDKNADVFVTVDDSQNQLPTESVIKTSNEATVSPDENEAIIDGTQNNADSTIADALNDNISDGSNANGNQNDGSGTKIQVVDLRTPGAENNTDAASDETTASDGNSNEAIPEVITDENTGDSKSGQNDDGFNNDSSRFTKTPETAKASETVVTQEANVNNASVTFQSVYQQVTTSTSYSASGYKGVNTENIINQIVQNAKVTITDTEHTMEMVLNPHELGRIFMEVSSKDGALRAKIFTENENVKTALENQMQILQKNFDEKGFKIDAVEISVGTHQFNENQEKSATGFEMFSQDRRGEQGETDGSTDNRTATRRIDLNNLDSLRGLMTQEELLTAQIMKEQGNTVDYTA